MSAPQFSRKIQNAFNGSKTPIRKKNVSRKVKHLFPQNEETAKIATKLGFNNFCTVEISLLLSSVLHCASVSPNSEICALII